MLRLRLYCCSLPHISAYDYGLCHRVRCLGNVRYATLKYPADTFSCGPSLDVTI